MFYVFEETNWRWRRHNYTVYASVNWHQDRSLIGPHKTGAVALSGGAVKAAQRSSMHRSRPEGASRVERRRRKDRMDEGAEGWSLGRRCGPAPSREKKSDFCAQK